MTLTTWQRVAAGATTLTVATAVTIAGCANNDSRSAGNTNTPTQSIPAKPSPTKTLDATQQAVASAQAAIDRYFVVLNKFSANPRLDQKELRRVAIGSGLIELRNIVEFDKAKNRHAIGDITIAGRMVRDVTLAYDPKKSPPDIPTVQVDVCYDVSKVNVVDDKTGKSVVPANRKPRAFVKLGVSNYEWPSSNGWKVSWSTFKGESCPPAL